MSTCILRMQLYAEPTAVTDALDYARRHCGRAFPSDVADRVSIAVYELLENAGKYTKLGGQIELEVHDGGEWFEVKVANDAFGARVALLTRQIEAAARLTTTEQYVETLRRKTSDEDPWRPGIGLFRVRHDALVDLVLSVDARRVVVTARGRFDARAFAPR